MSVSVLEKPKFIEVLGLKVFSDDLNLIPINGDKAVTINTVSPNSYGIAMMDESFKKTLAETDYLVLDGVYFAFASLLLNGENIKRNQGPDVFFHFINRIGKTGGKVFFLGSSEETLQKITVRATADYPNIEVMTYSPPFKDQF